MKRAERLAARPSLSPPAAAPGRVNADSRIPAIDGLRGVASLMVLCYHFGPNIVRAGDSRFQWLHRIPPLWFRGVDLFFVLSGFLIAGILVNSRSSPRYYSTFYARRAWRIFPLYFLILLGYVLAAGLTPDAARWRLFEHPLPVWSYLCFLQNFSMVAAGGFGAIWLAGTWSLAVQEQFYLTLPVLVRQLDHRWLFRIAVLAVAAPPVLRALIQYFKFLPGLANYVLLPTRVDSLAVGVLVLLLLRRHEDWLRNHRKPIAWSVLLALLGWSLYPFLPNPQAIRLAFLEHTVTALVFGGGLLCLLLFPLSWPARWLSAAPLRTLGNMAFSTYLFHPILLCADFWAFQRRDPALNSIADLPPLALAAAGTLLLAWLSWTKFETPLLRLAHRFTY